MRALLTAVDGDGEALAVVVRGDGLWVPPVDVGVPDGLGVPVALDVDADGVPDAAGCWLTPHPAKMRLPTKRLVAMATCFTIGVLL